MSEKSLMDTLKIKSKTIGAIIGAAIVYVVTTKAGFPKIFVYMFETFVLLCYLLFIALDLPAMKEQKGARAGFNIFISLVGLSVFLTGAGWMHPQYRPEFEIEKLNKPPLKEMPSGPEAIEAGYAIFQDNKCSNCHKTTRGGSSDRGPNFADNQIGAYSVERLKESIIDPRKSAPFGFRDAKSKKEMPTYYGDDLGKMDLDLLVVFLQTQVDDSKMPVQGSPAEKKKWSELEEFVALGKQVFEGEANEDINCSVCHGADGIPLMSDAADLRNKDWQSKRNPGKTLGTMSDGDWFRSVSLGVEDTAMAGWAEMGLSRYHIWCAIAYVRSTFQK